MIAIIDYNAGNLTSVRLALYDLGLPSVITHDPDIIRQADRIIFPGVGAAGAAMQHLTRLQLMEPLSSAISQGKPFLGICLGMQVLFDFSEENDGVDCLGMISGAVRRFQPTDPLCKIPQMGWNTVEIQRPHPIFNDIETESEFYFVHSYYPTTANPEYTLATTRYAGISFASVIGKDNLVATQFHPERSGRIGLKLLDNFCRWDGTC